MLLLPYTCGKHWTMYVLGNQGFFHFDSMASVGFHYDMTIRTQLTTLWTTRSGYAEQSLMWQNAQTPSVWNRLEIPQ